MPRCICDFPDTCEGFGMLHCRGCGGDQCVCAACFGHGEMDCDGCEDCRENDEGWDDDDDCLDCGRCPSCIERTKAHAEEMGNGS